jgi:hypothetical protein
MAKIKIFCIANFDETEYKSEDEIKKDIIKQLEDIWFNVESLEIEQL